MGLRFKFERSACLACFLRLMERLPFPSCRNDDRVTFERATTFASAWGSSFIDIGMQGHIGSAAKLGLLAARTCVAGPVHFLRWS
ncbi:alpha/beta hydrolase [Cupriavidus basilensis]